MSWVAVPGDHRGHEFGHEDRRVGRQMPERLAEGEPESEAADQRRGPVPVAEAGAGQFGHAFLRMVLAGGHQFDASHPDGKRAVMLVERERGSVRGRGLVEETGRFHDSERTRKP
jgi:hypothetical protein